MDPDEEMLAEITRRVVAVSQPERVILFGSRARGQAGKDGDFHLLVVKDDVDSTSAETARIYLALAGIKAPVDVMFVRSAYAKRYGDLVGTVLRPALREGKVLYARPE